MSYCELATCSICNNKRIREVLIQCEVCSPCLNGVDRRPITPAEREVIEAARAWHANCAPVLFSSEGARMWKAIGALPKPPPTLVERLRAGGWPTPDDMDRDLREAAARIEELERGR